MIRKTQTGPSDRDVSRITHFHALAHKRGSAGANRYDRAVHAAGCKPFGGVAPTILTAGNPDPTRRSVRASLTSAPD